MSTSARLCHGRLHILRQVQKAQICRGAKFCYGCTLYLAYPLHNSTQFNAPLRSIYRHYSYRSLSTTPNPHPWTDYEGAPVLLQTPPQALVPVDIPEDPKGVLKSDSSAALLFQQPGIFVVRQLEMLNLFIGYEQANRYRILDTHGATLGYLLEQDMGFMNNVARQVFKTHRAFRCTIMDASGNVVLRIHRPFSFINSRIYITDEQSNAIVGEAQQEWHPWRRKYNLFQRRGEDEYEQFAKIDTPFLSWEFMATTKDNLPIASIDRSFTGIARELFTDTGQYNLRFENVSELISPPSTEASENQSLHSLPSSTPSSALVSTIENEKAITYYKPPPITLDQRAILLAAAVCIDFDYFTRHSGGGLPIPIPFGLGGFGESAEGIEDVPPNTGSDENNPSVDGTDQSPPENPWDNKDINSTENDDWFGDDEGWDNEENPWGDHEGDDW